MGAAKIDSLRAENERLRRRLAELEGKGHGPSTDFLRAAVEAAPAFIMGAGADDRLRYINRIQPGLLMEEVLGSSIYHYVEPPYLDGMREAVEEARRTGNTARYHVAGTGADGERGYYDCYVSPLPEPEGTGVCIVAVDVTENRRREVALRESEEKLHIALSATRIGLWSLDLATGEVTWDEGMRELTGSDEPLGPERYLTLVHPEDRAGVGNTIERSFTTHRFVGQLHRIVRPDAGERWIVTTGRFLFDDAGEPVKLVGGNLDVTEQRQTEEQLRQAQKLDAVGRLTAGVAHNFNNMLAAILPTLELVRPRATERDQRLIDDAMHAGMRAAEMVRQLMTFAGQSRDGTWGPQNPGQLVESALSICQRTFDRHIALETRTAPGLPMLLGDGGALEQVLVNLLLNARDAVKGVSSPRISVEVDRVDAAEITAPPHAKAPHYLRIRVDDDGVGMDPEVQRRVFEPFFTTKEVGAGTGLGLATSYTIVREHGGWIDVDSQRGRGTRFSVFLPAQSSREQPRAPIPERPIGLPVGAKVLLVDDEPAVRHVVERLLRKLGHAVEAVADGHEALAALDADPAVDVVLLDRSMPGAPGDAFLNGIRERSPSAKVLLFTGHDVEPEARAEFDGMLSKPVTRDELEQAIAAVVSVGKPTV